MNKKRQVPRKYFIVQYCREEIRTFQTEEEYQKLIKKIKNSKNRKNYKLLFGNVRKSYDKYGNIIASISVYHKLTDRKIISEIDEETMQMDGMNQFIKEYSDKLRRGAGTPHIIYFGPRTYEGKDKKEYKFDVGICSEELFFKDDKKFMDKETIFKTFNHLAKVRNYFFFIKLSEYFIGYPQINEISDKLFGEVQKSMEYDEMIYQLPITSKRLYNELTTKQKNGVYETDKDGARVVDYKSKRTFASFMKKYYKAAIEYQYSKTNKKNERKLKMEKYNE